MNDRHVGLLHRIPRLASFLPNPYILGLNPTHAGLKLFTFGRVLYYH